MKEFKQVRENLIELLEELDERLSKITDDEKHLEQPIAKDFAEQTDEAENNEVLDALGNTTRNEMEKIKLAISRIDSGTYGICLSCGNPIKKDRLNAIPFSSKCIHCAEKNDNG